MARFWSSQIWVIPSFSPTIALLAISAAFRFLACGGAGVLVACVPAGGGSAYTHEAPPGLTRAERSFGWCRGVPGAGNHERRLLEWVRRHPPPSRKTIQLLAGGRLPTGRGRETAGPAAVRTSGA